MSLNIKHFPQEFLFIILAVGMLLMTGCSTKNDKSLINPDTGKHSANWYVDHRAAFLANPGQCTECHGNDLHGGISAVSCFSSSFKGLQCHASGPSGHPAGWASPDSHGASAKSFPNSAQMTGFSTCQLCHGSDFTGGLASQTCLNTAGCHGAGIASPHSPAPWILSLTSSRTHTTTNPANGPVCGLCHMGGRTPPSYVTLPTGTTPGCFNNTLCHGEPACGSCHGIPPDGTAFPNVAGRHAPHMAASTVINCSTCHFGAGEGTALHFNGVVNVIFDPAYNAKSGTAAYNTATGTCSNIVCHGSSRMQTASQASTRTSTPGATPVWLTGTIDVNTQCSLCHVLGPSAGSPENNSYFSGQHELHVYGEASGAFTQPPCTVCHDTTKLAAVHFTSLTAPISEATASTTTSSAINFNGITCNPACHGTETW
jgi:predicted CxxxxCH...CXXCH cytochrome family protein